MGILNLTPDSFSDPGLFVDPKKAVEHAHHMVAQGADIIDIGAESSRPGSAAVSAEEELERLIPVLKQLVKELKVPISVDTYKTQTARKALEQGVDIINDITGLRGEAGIPELIAQYRAGLVIMHMRGNPKTMQVNPCYDDVINQIKEFCAGGIDIAVSAGVSLAQIIIDPGIGFGKDLEHNLAIIRQLSEFKELGCPVLVGLSRKSFIGQILDLPIDQRLEGSLAASAAAVINGADIVRVHDIKETKRVLKVIEAISGKNPVDSFN